MRPAVVEQLKAEGRRRMFAVHEAGHAVVAELLGCRVRRASVGERFSEGYLGLVKFEPGHADVVQNLAATLAGPAAALYLGFPDGQLGDAGDRQNADGILSWMFVGGERAVSPLERQLSALFLHPKLWAAVEALADDLGHAGVLDGSAVRKSIRRSLGADYDAVSRFAKDYCRAAVARLVSE